MLNECSCFCGKIDTIFVGPKTRQIIYLNICVVFFFFTFLISFFLMAKRSYLLLLICHFKTRALSSFLFWIWCWEEMSFFKRSKSKLKEMDNKTNLSIDKWDLKRYDLTSARIYLYILQFEIQNKWVDLKRRYYSFCLFIWIRKNDKLYFFIDWLLICLLNMLPVTHFPIGRYNFCTILYTRKCIGRYFERLGWCCHCHLNDDSINPLKIIFLQF